MGKNRALVCGHGVDALIDFEKRVGLAAEFVGGGDAICEQNYVVAINTQRERFRVMVRSLRRVCFPQERIFLARFIPAENPAWQPLRAGSHGISSRTAGGEPNSTNR